MHPNRCGRAAKASLDDTVRLRHLIERFGGGVISPQVRQAEPAECGIAALAIVMGHHGVHVPLAALRERAASRHLGLTARRLLAIARTFGFTAKAISCEIDVLAEIGLPLIAHFRFNHYLVIERVGRRSVRVNDPINGPRILPRRVFSEGFTGVVLSLQPAAGVEPSGNRFSPGRELLRCLRPLAGRAAAAVALSTSAAVCLAVAAAAGGRALASIASHQASLSQIASVMIAALACAGLIAASERMAVSTAAALARRQTDRILRRLANLPAEYFRNRLPARLAATVQAGLALNDAGAAAAALQLPALGVFGAAALAFGGRLALPVIVLAVAELALIIAAGTWRGSSMARVESTQLPVVGVPGSVAAAPTSRRIGDNGDDLFGRLAQRHALAMASILPAAEARAAVETLRVLLQLGRLLGVMLPLAVALPAGIGLADGTALVIITIAIGAALDRVADGFAPARLLRALYHFDDLEAAARSTPAPSPATGGRLVVAELVWAPHPSAEPVLAGLSVDLPKGGALAVCGLSSSGKSALARMIAGDLVPTAGSVEIGGGPAALSPPGVVVLIDRRPSLIAASIRDNLCLGRAVADGELLSLLDGLALGAILAPRGGLDLVLERQGQELAPSERYRLAIGRALLQQPSILVLDDMFQILDAVLTVRIGALLRHRDVSLVATGQRLPAGMGVDRLLNLSPRMAAAATAG